MNSQHSGLTNSAIGAALVGIIVWLASLVHIAIPDVIQSDIIVLLSWGAGYLLNVDPKLAAMADDIATIANTPPPAPVVVRTAVPTAPVTTRPLAPAAAPPFAANPVAQPAPQPAQ